MMLPTAAALLLVAWAPAQGLRKKRRANKTETRGLCDPWEICKCTPGWDEASATCQTDTCTYSPLWGRPSICCPAGGWYCDDPECKTIESWENCEWANWNYEGDVTTPGAGIYSDVPLWTAPREITGGFAVMSDVDDTMECSGGPPGGEDTICLGTAQGELYPGVAEFALALARGPSDITNPRKVAPLSARPSELEFFLGLDPDSPENTAYRAAAEAVGIQGWGLDTDNALYGSIFDVTDWVHLPGTELTRFNKFGYRKYSNWKSIGRQWGGPVAFIGDNGQGDFVAAQLMLRRSEGLSDEEGALRAAFIHDVLRGCSSSECRDAWASRGVHIFEHYPHAAGLAARQGFISSGGCQAVCAAAPMLPCSCP